MRIGALTERRIPRDSSKRASNLVALGPTRRHLLVPHDSRLSRDLSLPASRRRIILQIGVAVPLFQRVPRWLQYHLLQE